MDKPKFIIWGAGKSGKGMMKWILEYADVIGFYDSDLNKFLCEGGGGKWNQNFTY